MSAGMDINIGIGHAAAAPHWVNGFSPSYARARVQFLEAAARTGWQLSAYAHPLAGCAGEDLATDVAVGGDMGSPRVLLVSSACHGIEGYCGSGIQVALLNHPDLLASARAAGVRLVLAHALNPHGFSFGRRVTQENVDLNRNFVDFAQPLPPNPDYDQLHDALLPAQWPPTGEVENRLGQFVAARGPAAFQAALSQGQYRHPDGLFYGGQAPTWSRQTVESLLRSEVGGQRVSHLGWIDLHTGLGPNGVGERIFAGRDRAADIDRARRWWAGGGKTPITSIYDGSSTSSRLHGLMWMSAYEACPGAEITGIALEYGTQPLDAVSRALRADHWLHRHPDAGQPLAADIRQGMRDAFYTDTAAWKIQVVEQALDAVQQAIAALHP
jgi:Protein of unknown function (DUF2817)